MSDKIKLTRGRQRLRGIPESVTMSVSKKGYIRIRIYHEDAVVCLFEMEGSVANAITINPIEDIMHKGRYYISAAGGGEKVATVTYRDKP